MENRLRWNGCCLFDQEKDEIVCVYVGDTEPGDLAKGLGQKLPGYMLPNRYEKPDRLPMTINDKIDRVTLKKTYIG